MKLKSLLVALFAFLCLNASSQTLMIFGGRDHDVYLGNINTNKFDSNSIWNKFGTYGNKFNSKCIWNKYGTYGGSYSEYSPFNRFSQHPPVIVDADGNFYGYFTANTTKAKRTNYRLALIIIDNWEDICDDVGAAYDAIFN